MNPPEDNQGKAKSRSYPNSTRSVESSGSSVISQTTSAPGESDRGATRPLSIPQNPPQPDVIESPTLLSPGAQAVSSSSAASTRPGRVVQRRGQAQKVPSDSEGVESDDSEKENRRPRRSSRSPPRPASQLVTQQDIYAPDAALSPNLNEAPDLHSPHHEDAQTSSSSRPPQLPALPIQRNSRGNRSSLYFFDSDIWPSPSGQENAAVPVPHPNLVAVPTTPDGGARSKPKTLKRKKSQRQPPLAIAPLSGLPVPPTAPQGAPVIADPRHFDGRSPHTVRAEAEGQVERTCQCHWWIVTSWIVTFWAPPFILKHTVSPDRATQQAWREKVALCFFIMIMGAIVGFLTLGLTKAICSQADSSNYLITSLKVLGVPSMMIRGQLFDPQRLFPPHYLYQSFASLSAADQQLFTTLSAVDVSPLFPSPVASACSVIANTTIQVQCSVPQFPKLSYCHGEVESSSALRPAFLGTVRYPWELVRGNPNLVVFSSRVLNVSDYLNSNTMMNPQYQNDIRNAAGTDVSLMMSRSSDSINTMRCMAALYTVGYIDEDSFGCIANSIILYLSLLIILGVVLSRFFLAVMFDWFLSWKLGKLELSRAEHERAVARGKRPSSRPSSIMRKGSTISLVSAVPSIDADKSKDSLEQSGGRKQSVGAVVAPAPAAAPVHPFMSSVHPVTEDAEGNPIPDELRQYYTVLLVTCYSEDEHSLRKTLDSVAGTTYSDPHKLLFVVADGIIKGEGSMTTPDIVLGMMEQVEVGPVEPMSYIAIADGNKRHNKARVYVGYYHCDTQYSKREKNPPVTHHRVPMVVIVKCGNDSEQGKPKPGNRGKRDGQIILMDFFSKILLDDRLSPLQFDLFCKLYGLTGINPGNYEIVLMVDADTKVHPDSLTRLVAAMARDPLAMGLCGETRVENKSQSWVTLIQVFEYYINHHLGKAFESVFGGVTCLPGCFCTWRIKARRPDGYWVPILCSPTIVQMYSENVVDTLHKKNLLSLGEDRYLTTLMLRNFPKRKNMFIPKASCKTVVPHTFAMLLSQRRRWINSTVHNLLELVLVRELCGIFCFSMQFVVLLELVGTAVLPVAISMTIYLIVTTALGDVQLIPLIMLFCVLGLPAILILFTSRKILYIYWMLIYLLSLPVWNLVLPVYAFWHFDDFSWGITRKTEDDKKGGGDHAKKEGEFDASSVPLCHLKDWLSQVTLVRVAAQPSQVDSRRPSTIPSAGIPASNSRPASRSHSKEWNPEEPRMQPTHNETNPADL